MSQKLVKQAILPFLKHCDPRSCLATSTIARRLRVALPEADILIRTLDLRMRAQEYGPARADFRLALDVLSGKRDARDVPLRAPALVVDMKVQQDGSALASLAFVLTGLKGTIELQGVHLGIGALLDRIMARDVLPLMPVILV